MNDNIKNRILILTALPILVLMIYIGNIVLNSFETARQIDHLKPLTILASSGSELVHNLQVERGSSVGFISSKGSEKFKAIVSKRAKSLIFPVGAKAQIGCIYNSIDKQIQINLIKNVFISI